MPFSFPPLPPGACHWEILGIGIVYASPECPHIVDRAKRELASLLEVPEESLPDLNPNGDGAPRLVDLDGKYRIEQADVIWDWDGGRQGKPRKDWPSILYADPADFFDDNQVIDV